MGVGAQNLTDLSEPVVSLSLSLSLTLSLSPRFNGHFAGGPGLAMQYQNDSIWDFNETVLKWW